MRISSQASSHFPVITLLGLVPVANSLLRWSPQNASHCLSPFFPAEIAAASSAIPAACAGIMLFWEPDWENGRGRSLRSCVIIGNTDWHQKKKTCCSAMTFSPVHLYLNRQRGKKKKANLDLEIFCDFSCIKSSSTTHCAIWGGLHTSFVLMAAISVTPYVSQPRNFVFGHIFPFLVPAGSNIIS